MSDRFYSRLAWSLFALVLLIAETLDIVGLLTILTAVFVSALSLVFRYRRASGEERQQIK